MRLKDDREDVVGSAVSRYCLVSRERAASPGFGPPGFVLRRTKSWQGGIIVACVTVSAALIVRLIFETFGHFYYLPMVPAVMVTALLARRAAVVLSIALAISANLWLVPRESVVDALANARKPKGKKD